MPVGDSRITFKRTDTLPGHLITEIIDIADHFRIKRKYFRHFCRLILTSKTWKYDELIAKLSKWAEYFGRMRGTKTIIDLVEKAFSKCRNDEDISDLRGAMLEALLLGKHGGAEILASANYGWGAIVQLDCRDIRYVCTEKKYGEECGNRSTVDLGYWNGFHGKFYECKVSPKGIGCKEMQYFKKLHTTLKNNSISHELFFVCAESQEAVTMRIVNELGFDGILFKAIGYEQLSA